MTLRSRYVASYACGACGVAVVALEMEAVDLAGPLPVPTLPRGWVERRTDSFVDHYCTAACELRALCADRVTPVVPPPS